MDKEDWKRAISSIQVANRPTNVITSESTENDVRGHVIHYITFIDSSQHKGHKTHSTKLN